MKVGERMTGVSRGQLYRDSRWICIQMEQCVNHSLAQKDITAVQANILLYILHRGGQGISLTDIHRTFGYSMATLSNMVKRLREKGYIQAEHCCGDDRCRLLSGTEKSRRIQKDLEETITSVQGQLYDGFSQEELCTLDRLQGKLVHNLTAFEKRRQKEEQTS